jgi:hypothetical protein
MTATFNLSHADVPFLVFDDEERCILAWGAFGSKTDSLIYSLPPVSEMGNYVVLYSVMAQK